MTYLLTYAAHVGGNGKQRRQISICPEECPKRERIPARSGIPALPTGVVLPAPGSAPNLGIPPVQSSCVLVRWLAHSGQRGTLCMPRAPPGSTRSYSAATQQLEPSSSSTSARTLAYSACNASIFASICHLGSWAWRRPLRPPFQESKRRAFEEKRNCLGTRHIPAAFP